MVYLVLSNIQYSLLKKQSENPTTATIKHPQTLSKPSPILIWNQNNKLHSPDLPVPSLPVLPTDIPLHSHSPFGFTHYQITFMDTYDFLKIKTFGLVMAKKSWFIKTLRLALTTLCLYIDIGANK